MINPLYFACGLMAMSAYGLEDYSTWSSSQVVSINTTSTGANVTDTILNFPTLVRLTPAQASVFAGASANGADVRFVANDGTTRLRYQKERWDPVGQLAEFWVLLPKVEGNAVNTFRIYWGKTGAADSSSGPAVFDTANGFRAVWHMNANGAGDEADATANGLTMGAINAPASNTAGAVGPARTLNGTSQYFVASNPPTFDHPAVNIGVNSPHTISAWTFISAIAGATNNGPSIINKGDRQYNLQVFGNSSTAKYYETQVYTTGYRQTISPTVAVIGAWVQVTGTWSGGATFTNGTGRLYLNGVKVRDSTTLAIGPANGTLTTSNVYIGANSYTAGATSPTNPPSGVSSTIALRYMNGHMDEVSISGVARSAGWIKLSYETQKPGSSVVSLGGTTGTVDFKTSTPFDFRVRSSGSSFIFSFPEGPEARISVMDSRGREVWSHSTMEREAIWNGQASNGARLSPGIYVARIMVRGKGNESSTAQRLLSLVP